MAGEVETLGEKLKRLQEAARSVDRTVPNILALSKFSQDPAFADYVIGLERDKKNWSDFMELLGEFSGEVSNRDLSKADAFIHVWQKMKERAEKAESSLAAKDAEIERLEKTIDEWISHEETSRREYSEKLDIAIDLRTKLAAANQRIEELEERVKCLELTSGEVDEEDRGILALWRQAKALRDKARAESASSAQPAECRCAACLDKDWQPGEGWMGNIPPSRRFMVLCQTCGNKRCPHATHHDNPCTGSNESGQPGSRFCTTTPTEAKPCQ